MKNTVISCNFLEWKFFGKAQFPNRPKLYGNFPQNFLIKKLGKITVFHVVINNIFGKKAKT